VAWPDWECAFVAEVEPFASAVLQHRYPAVPNLGDITQEDFCDRATSAGPIDVLIGGTPCQSFSIAGTRGGLDDPRGQLSLAFVEIVNRLRPRYVIWENVPGVLSSGGGRDFGAFIGALADVGYRLAYRILDAQYFGVAQRRKRVFVVGCTGDGDPAEILALREGLSGDPAPCREEGEDLARPLAGRTGGSRQDLDNDTYVTNQETFPCIDANMDRKWGSNQWVDRGQYVYGVDEEQNAAHEKSGCLKAREKGGGHERFVASVTGSFEQNSMTGRGTLGWKEGEEQVLRPVKGQSDHQMIVTDMRGNGDGQVVPTLVGDHLNRPTDYTPMVADPLVAREGATYTHEGANNFRLRNCVIDEQQVTSKANRTQPTEDHAPPLTQAGRHLCWPEVAPTTIRRLTPRECERLQGFPDDWTLIPWTHGKPAADTPRYKAIGNSMAVPVIRWIGERIECDIHAT